MPLGGLMGRSPEQLSLSSKELDHGGLSQDHTQLSRLGDLKVTEPHFREPNSSNLLGNFCQP